MEMIKIKMRRYIKTSKWNENKSPVERKLRWRENKKSLLKTFSYFETFDNTLVLI